MKANTAPRVYCIPATAAPVVAVFRRGPANWSHVARWDLFQRRYEPGAWFHGRIFPRRSDLSPDGRLLCYFAHKPGATWTHGEAYVGISRLPWLATLQAFATCGTWTRGYYFIRDGASDDGEQMKLPIPYDLRSIPAVQFANERRRGWKEAPFCPPRDPDDIWDQRRNARMEKRQPGGRRLLCVESVGWAGGEFGVDQAVDGVRVRYSLEFDGKIERLDDVQWGDWDQEGQLLIATRSGKLQIRKMIAHRSDIVFEEDLSIIEPNPRPAPAWAHRL